MRLIADRPFNNTHYDDRSEQNGPVLEKTPIKRQKLECEQLKREYFEDDKYYNSSGYVAQVEHGRKHFLDFT